MTDLDYTALNTLPEAELSCKLVDKSMLSEGKMKLSVKNHSKTVACANRIRLVNTATQERILPVIMSDNYITLMPGEERTIFCWRFEQAARSCCPCTIGIVAGLLQSVGCEDHIRTGGWRNLLPDSVASAGDTGRCIHCGQSLWKAEGISEICGDNGRLMLSGS